MAANVRGVILSVKTHLNLHLSCIFMVARCLSMSFLFQVHLVVAARSEVLKTLSPQRLLKCLVAHVLKMKCLEMIMGSVSKMHRQESVRSLMKATLIRIKKKKKKMMMIWVLLSPCSIYPASSSKEYWMDLIPKSLIGNQKGKVNLSRNYISSPEKPGVRGKLNQSWLRFGTILVISVSKQVRLRARTDSERKL